MVGWNHWFHVHELSKLQEIWKAREAWHAAIHVVRHKESDTTEGLNNNNCILNNINIYIKYLVIPY